MSEVFGLIKVVIVCGSVLLLALMVLVSMPRSRMRDVLVQVVGWAFALFCGAYVVSPVDVMPEAFLGPLGLVDDAGAIVAGLLSARAAWNAGKKPQVAR